MSKRDHIDDLITKWAAERPDYNLAPVEIIGRMGRIMSYVDRALETKFQEFGLSRPGFDVLATLRRAGPPYGLLQRDLVRSLLRTSGSISVRIDALEQAGLVLRELNDEDRRATLVTLTAKGHELVEQIVPEHLANESELVSGLSVPERKALVALLRKWLASLESESDNGRLLPLGLVVLPPRPSLQKRRAAGLPDHPGLLIHSVEPDTPADTAGFRKGDLIVAVNEQNVSSFAALYSALHRPSTKLTAVRILRGAERRALKLPKPVRARKYAG